MATRYRKRVKVASGVYMDISKNGINTSAGVRGASMTFGKNGIYINTGVPGTGFYTRQRGGGASMPHISYSAQQVNMPKIHAKGTYTFTAVLCGVTALACLTVAPVGLIGTFIFGLGVWGNLTNRKKYYGKNATQLNESLSFLSDAKEAFTRSANEREKKILSNFINTVEIIDAIDDEEKILASLNQNPRKNAEVISEHITELNALRRKLQSTKYDVDESVPAEVVPLYEHLCQSFEQLLTAEKIWIQASKLRNTVAKSSAGSLVSLQETVFGVGVFNYIQTKYDVPVIPIGNQLLYLYPQYGILSTTPAQFEIVDYADISLQYTPISFQEPGAYPTDAEKIGTTWEYVNKDGSPDRRYANNRQISVVSYGGINLIIKGKLSVTFQVSNPNSTRQFCLFFNKFSSVVRDFDKGDSTAESKVIPATTTPAIASNPISGDCFSLAEIIQAAEKLYLCLVEMSSDKQILEILDDQKQLDKALELNIGGGVIDKRLAVVAVTDLVKCFNKLGHRPDMSTDEGRAIGIILSRILLSDNMVCNDQSLIMTEKGTKHLEECYNLVKNHLHIEYDPDRLLLIEMLRHEGVDDETVNKWAVLLYRYALLIAKADGHISKTEQDWLTNILSFTNSSIGETSDYCPSSKTIQLPQMTDDLFADVARYIVTSGIASTSGIQRRFCIGYNRAGKIMDELETTGIIGPAQGGNPRDILIDALKLESLLSRGSLTLDPSESRDASDNGEQTTKVAPKKVQRKNISDPMKELDDLIGLTGVKIDIANIYNLVKIQKVRVAKGLNVPQISYHCVFTGNPGTGKTTVARMVAQIYKRLGILRKGHLIETDRSGLVAEYVGQTAVKTNKIIDSALDGVLFIDEAYSLVQNIAGNDFGVEAIATLLKRMEDNRDRLVVILAGYSDEMQQFLNSNPGLQSRFSRYIHFDDYSADELASIYKFNLAKYDYKMTPEAWEAINEVIAEAVDNKDKHFGNARFVRNLFEKTLERQARRLTSSKLSSLTEEDLTEITKEDIP